jgi:hypothetical protein
MKKLLLVLLLVPCIANAQQNSTVIIKTAFAYEQITFTNVAAGFSSNIYNPTVAGVPSSQSRAELATMNCETASASIRARWDGTAPTSTVGVIINQSDFVSINGFGNISKFQAIITAATNVTCNVTYYRASSNAP